MIPNGFALNFNGRDATDTMGELGARFDRVLAVYSNAVLALRGRVAWAHDWVSDPALTPLFQALPGASFIVNRAVLPQNSALASAGGASFASQTGSRYSPIQRRVRLALIDLRRNGDVPYRW